MVQDEEKYRIAEKRVRRVKQFYKHLSTWIFTSIFLALLFFALRMPPFITLVCVAGWGIGIASEAVEVFGFPGIGKNWEERMIEEELRKMDRKQQHAEFYEQEEYLDLEEEDPDELDLEELKELRKNWKDSDFV